MFEIYLKPVIKKEEASKFKNPELFYWSLYKYLFWFLRIHCNPICMKLKINGVNLLVKERGIW
jgi:hypothetical protein